VVEAADPGQRQAGGGEGPKRSIAPVIPSLTKEFVSVWFDDPGRERVFWRKRPVGSDEILSDQLVRHFTLRFGPVVALAITTAFRLEGADSG
jgi:hypothetical protein